MSAKDSATLVRLKSLIKAGRGVVLNRELGFLTFMAESKDWGTPFVFEIDLQPPWGYRVSVSLYEDVVVKGDDKVAKMIKYVVKQNVEGSRLSRLNFDIDSGKISAVCHMLYDEPPTYAELRRSLKSPAKLLANSLLDILEIAQDDPAE